MRKLLCFATLLLLGFNVLPVRAQSTWAAWLSGAEPNQIIKVNQNGFVEDAILPVPDGFDRISEISISPNGKLMAYAYANSVSDEALSQMAIYDHDLRSVVASYDLTGVAYIGRISSIFNHDNTQLAIAYDLAQEQNWEIVIIDLVTMQMVSDLRFDDELAVAAGVQRHDLDINGLSLMFFRNGLLGFGDQFFNTFEQSESYLWDIAADTLIPNSIKLLDVANPLSVLDVYPATGEMLIVTADNRFPSDVNLIVPLNALQIYDPVAGTLTPFYYDGVNALAEPKFVANNQYILFREKSEIYNYSFGDLRVITPDGISLSENVSADVGLDSGVLDIKGTPDGFVYTRNDTPTLQLYEVNLIETGELSEGKLIYDSGIPSQDNYLGILWVGSEDGSSLFLNTRTIPFAQLADPTPIEGGAPVTASQPLDDVLREGAIAIVNTTGGDSLNLRTYAGVEYQISRKLKRGTEVTVLEGSVDADGFPWWRVRTEDGLTGWVVASADGIQTLLPEGVYVSGGGTLGAGDEEVAADPSLSSLLAIGDRAAVTLTAQRDALRMRNGAGLDFTVVTLLPNGTRVTLVDGPIAADDLLWWQIRTPEGNVGWAAEVVGGERTLTKSDFAAAATLTPVPGTVAALAKPLLVSPLPGTQIVDEAVKLEWAPVPDATGYTLEVEVCDSAGGTCVPSSNYGQIPNPTLTVTLEPGIYRWRVGAFETTRVSEMSDWWTFTLNPES